jgi:hypothetical protein
VFGGHFSKREREFVIEFLNLLFVSKHFGDFYITAVVGGCVDNITRQRAYQIKFDQLKCLVK